MYTELFFGLKDTIAATADQHKRLLAAMAKRDAGKAMAVMKEALDYGGRKIREALSAL